MGVPISRVGLRAAMALALIGTIGALVGRANAAPITVRMIEFVRTEEAEWQKKVVERFHASRADIRIELISTAGASLNDKMLALLAAGAPVDIGYQDPYQILAWADQGIVRDLRPYVERDRQALSEFFGPLLDLYATGRARYGIPIDLQVQALFYSEEAFAEAGLQMPWDGMQWEDVAQFGPKLTLDRNNDGTVERWGMRFPQFWHWWSMLWHFGAAFFDDEKNPTRFAADSIPMRGALDFLHRLIHEKRVMSPRNIKGVTSVNLVKDRTIAMAVGNSLYMQDMVRLSGEVPWNVARLPYGPAGNMAWFNALGWFVFEAAAQPAEAWEVIRFFSSEASMRLSVEMRGTLVPHKRVTQEVWTRAWKVPTNRHVFTDAIGTARGLPNVHGAGLDAIIAGVNAVADGAKPVSQVIEDWRRQLGAWLGERQRAR